MRLLIVSDAWEPQINGVVRTYQNIVRELRAMGHTAEVIGPGHFFSVPMPGYAEIRLSLFAGRALARMIADFAPDAIHIAVEGPLGLAARRYCLRRGLPFSTTYHTHFPDYAAQRVPFLQDAVRRAAIIFVRRFHDPAKCTFVATQSLEEQLRAWDFRAPLVRLTRGVDFGIFHTGPRTLFADLPRPVQIYVGRVSIEKNIEAFLGAPVPGSKVVVGDGPALADLRRKYPYAVFTGAKTGAELGDHFRSADVFVFPSRTDTFGMVIIEALACGLPVAGYDVTGPRDIITHPLLGATDTDLGAAIARALEAPGTAAEREADARAAYSWRAVAQTFLDASISAH